jgi:hypothetical protein
MLLTVAASFDRRTIADEDAIAWAAALPDIEMVEARDAVVAHYRESRQWVMPNDILRRVFRRRDENRRAVGTTTVTPPSALADTPRTEAQWIRIYRASVGRGAGHDAAVTEACRRLQVAPDTAALGDPARVRAAIEATTKAMRGTGDV